MPLLDSRLIFGLGAFAYDAMTRQSYWRDQVRTLLDFLPDADRAPGRGLRVLDVGCGPGVSTFALAEGLPGDASLVGADIAPRMVARARLHHRASHAHLRNIDFLVADASALPLADASVDLVTGHSFLYLVANRRAVLADIARVLRPGGMISLMEPRAGGSLAGAAVAALPRAMQLAANPVPAARFATSMVAWRLFSRVQGRISPPLVEPLLREAGLVPVATTPTLAGLGLHCIARR